jgi:hypothetical protein
MQSSDPVNQFSGRRYINLESYKKSGEPKLTLVQSIMDNGVVYFRTGPETWKIKPTGAWRDGDARILEGEESDRVREIFEKEYGAVGNSVVKFVGRLRGERLTTFVSISLQPSSPPGANQQLNPEKGPETLPRRTWPLFHYILCGQH